MATTGLLSHIDLSVADPDRSIHFYDAFFTALGYRRLQSDDPDWRGPRPRRAAWVLPDPGRAGSFGVECRPARGEHGRRRYDRYAPGPHHIAFQAETMGVVDAVHTAMHAVGADVLDPPTDYGGHPAYGDFYYAVFFADPDGVKLEVVCTDAGSKPD
jgi:catechol 2,3-dioxygenase-like lactoylglutathione lyase family enzyme